MCLLLFPQRAPAPLIYTAGEGWRYEKVGGGDWVRGRAKDQLDVAVAAFDGKDYGVALKAARRTVKQWPFSDYAPEAQYLLGRCYEAKNQDEKAFKAYQELIAKYPKIDNYDEVVLRQFVIADKYLGGQWFKLWGYIPLYPSMDKTIKMYEQIIKNGLYSKVAPYAQLRIGAANEKRLAPQYDEAAKAYERAADRYSDLPIGTDGLFKAGLAFQKQAKRAEYDQSVAGQAIATFSDFMTLYPTDQRVPEAQKAINAMKTEQARGSFEVAKFYEKRGRWTAARIYYNDAAVKDPGSQYSEEARRRIDAINQRFKE
jgi:outer membrane assembly lipoprotein YfiO